MSDKPAAETRYWVRTEQGRTWGPYTAAILERMRGQLTGRCEVSLDGKAFQPSAAFPELKDLLVPPREVVQTAPRDRPPPRISPVIAAAFGIRDELVQPPPDAQEKTAEPAPEAVAQAVSRAPQEPRPQQGQGAQPGQSAQKPPPPAAHEIPQVLPEEGKLEEVSPVRLYALAALTSASGWLQLALESGRMLQVSFRRGAPEHLASDDPDHSLARYLQQRGALTPAQGLQAEEHAQKAGLDVVSALFALQLIPPADAHKLLGEHAQFLLDKVLVSWRGTFSFEKDAPPPPGSFPLGQRWTLLAESMRRLEPAPLRAKLGQRMQRAVLRSGGLGLGRIEELALNAQEARLYASIDGTRTGDELLKTLDAAVTVRLLYLLNELGHLSFVEEEAAAPAPASMPAREGIPTPRAGSPVIARGPRPSEQVRGPPPVVRPMQAAEAPRAPAPAATPSRPAAAARESPAAARPAPARAPAAPTVTIATGPANETPQAQFARLVALQGKLLTADHFQALGLSRKATAADVKRTFFQLARELHPDTVTDPNDQELRALKEGLFARVNEAAQALSDEKRRKEYEAELDGKASNVDVARIFAAEEAFQRAEIIIKARRYQEGLDLLEEAITLNDQEAEFFAWRGYAKFLVSKERKVDYADCVADCKHALKLVDRCLPAHLFMGHMAKAIGEVKAAAAAYHRVLELDPKHVEAQRELRIMGKK